MLLGYRDAQLGAFVQIGQAHLVQVAREQPFAAFIAAQQADFLQVAGQVLQQRVGQHRLQTQDFIVGQALALGTCMVEAAEQAQQAIELVALRQAQFHRLVAEGRHRRGQRRAQQHRHPAQVDPQQQDRHERHRAVELLVGLETAQIGADAPLHQFQDHRRQDRAGHRVPPFHRVVRHHPEHQRDADELDQDRRQPQRELGQPTTFLGPEQWHREHTRRHGQRSGSEHRAQRQYGPVDQEAGQLGPGRADPPDLVEGLFNAVEGDQQRYHQRDEASGGELAGTGRELPQVALRRTRGVGHEVGEDVIAELVAPAVEDREGREHAEHHDGQRHQREHRGVRQRRRCLEQAVVEEAMPQEAAETDGPCAIPRALHPQVERIQRFHRRKGTRCGMLAG